MNKIKETANYTLTVEPAVDKPHDILYRVTNKKYGVVEVETSMLPQAIKYLHDLEAGLAAVEDMYETRDKDSSLLKVIPTKLKPKFN